METKIKFLDIYTIEDVKKLPSYIQKQIDNVFVEGKTKRTLILPNGQRFFMGNKLNDLTGSQWTFFTNSVVNTSYSTTGEDGCAYKIRKIHPSPKPPRLLKDIIEFFTKENDLVFDFFAGVGGTLLAASMANRKAIGIELSEQYVQAYKEASVYMGLKEQKMLCGDCLKIMKSGELDKEFTKKSKLILIDPPYMNMMSMKKTADGIKKYGKNPSPFTALENDLGNMNTEQFWDSFIQSINLGIKYLDEKGHVAVFIKDLQPKGKNNNLLHAEMINKITENCPLDYLGLKIWADQTVMLFPYGYPFEFVSNQIHQFILFFKLSQ